VEGLAELSIPPALTLQNSNFYVLMHRGSSVKKSVEVLSKVVHYSSAHLGYRTLPCGVREVGRFSKYREINILENSTNLFSLIM